MAVVGIEITAEIAELRQLQKDIGRLFTPADKAKILKAAMEKAIQPAFDKLKAITPVGPTGNLQRAATKKVKSYSQSGVAVGLIGYTQAGRDGSQSAAGGTVRAGKDRAFHQWWLENGTDERIVTKLSTKPYGRRGHLRRIPGRPAVEVRPHIVQKGQNAVIASSFNRLGPFKMVPTARPARGEDGQRIQTDPATPRAFFKKGKKGEAAIRIPAMPRGGTAGQPPVQTAWDATKGTVAEILQRELRISLEQALSTLTRRTGTLSE